MEFLKQNINGYEMLIYKNEFISDQIIKYKKFYEQHSFEHFNSYIPFIGTFLDIGANIGNHALMFNYFRPNDFNKQTAIAEKQGEAELFFYHNKSAINTLSKEMHSSRGGAAKEIRKIQTETLNDVIKDSPFADKKINLLTIDVEGFEMNVLKGFDLEKYSPEAVVVEYIDPSMKKEEFYNQNINNIINSELYNFMKDRNYTLVNWLHTDLIFINNRIKD